MMVVKANKHADGIGGHLSTFASSASLYEIGFNHFFRGKDDGNARRPRLLPGSRRARHLRPGLSRGPPDRRRPRPLPPGDRTRRARPVELPAPPADARLLGVPDGVDGPRPDHRALPRPLQPLPPEPPDRRHQPEPGVGFLGDGECDEPETLGAISLASREQLDNLVFVVNCNLQRLDGPVRGNGKIIQELEARVPRRRLERDQGDLGLEVGRAAGPGQGRRAAQQDEHHRRRRSSSATRVESGEYIRDHFFGPDPRLRQMVLAPHRRRPAQPAPRRSRLPQALRRLQGGHREPRQRRARP